MRAAGWSGRALACLAACGALVAATGCKTMSEKYIALEVWKYEKCFGHLPPGFVPPGAAQPAAAPPRVCGQGGPCQQPCQTAGCDQCQGAIVEGGHAPAGVALPAGPGGSPGPAATLPTPAGVTSGKPVVISDEVVIP